jgi:HK97 family phage major capsid protein
MEMTKEQLDALVAGQVEKKLAEKAAEQKSALRADMQEAFEASQKVVQAKGYKEEPAILKFAKLVRLAAAGNCQPDKMNDMAEKMYADDIEIKGYTKKALEAGVPTSGGFGIPQPLSARVIEALYANTIIQKVGVSSIPLANGRLDMARMDTTSTISWVGELPTNTPTAPTFGQVSLAAKKLSAMTEISNSLLRYNSVGIDSWVAKDLQNKFRIALDTAAFYGAGTLYTPAGMDVMSGIQSAGSASTALTQTAPRDMIALLKAANVSMTNVCWAMSPQMESWLMNLKTTTGAWIFMPEMAERGTLCGYRYFVSTSISYTDTTTDYADLWLVDYDYFMWGVGLEMELRMSQDASFVSGGTTYSAFQRDSTLIRVIGEHDFNVMQPKAIVKGIWSVA